MRSIEQYNDFVRRKCELATGRPTPPKTPNRRPKFARARLVGVDRVVGEALTDVPLVGFVQRLAPEVVDKEEVKERAEMETQTSLAPLTFSMRAEEMMRRVEMTEQEVRDHIDSGAIKQIVHTGHIDKILEARKHLHTPHAH